MNKFVSIFIQIFAVITISFFFVPRARAAISENDKQEIKNVIEIIERAVNQGDAQTILNLLSQNASEEMKSEIRENINGKNITYNQQVSKYKEISDTEVKVTGGYNAQGGDGSIRWEYNGWKNYFLFDKDNGIWKLRDSDFQKKLTGDFMINIFKTIGKYMLYTSPIWLMIIGFWMWMLVDAVQRSFKDKTVWIIVIIFVGFIGAILYYFIVRRKNKKANTLK